LHIYQDTDDALNPNQWYLLCSTDFGVMVLSSQWLQITEGLGWEISLVISIKNRPGVSYLLQLFMALSPSLLALANFLQFGSF
jgi:hypothetical protein